MARWTRDPATSTPTTGGSAGTAPLPSAKARVLLGDEILRGDPAALDAAARTLDLADDVAPLVAWLRDGGAPPERLATPPRRPYEED